MKSLFVNLPGTGLSYSVSVPKDVRSSKAPFAAPRRQRFYRIGEFGYSRGGDELRLTVDIDRRTLEVDPLTVALDQMQKQRYRVLEARIDPTRGGWVGDVLAESSNGGAKFLLRSFVFGISLGIVWVEVAAKAADFLRNAAVVYEMLFSFAFSEPQEGTIEGRTHYDMPRLAAKLCYPPSWTVNLVNELDHRVTVHIQDDSTRPVNGYIIVNCNIDWTDDGSASARWQMSIAELLDQVSVYGLRAVGTRQMIDIECPLMGNAIYCETYAISSEKIYVAYVVSAVKKGHCLSCMLLTPPKHGSPEAWARNVRVFDIVRESLGKL